MNQVSDQSTRRSSGWIWPVAIVGVLAAQAAFIAAVITVASRDPSNAIEPNYYEKAVKWDTSSRAAHAWEDSGWSLDFSFETVDAASIPTSTKACRLVAHLRDGDAHQTNASSIEVECFHQARSGERFKWTLVPRAHGEFESSALHFRPGLWEIRATLSVHGVDATVLRTIEAPAFR